MDDAEWLNEHGDFDEWRAAAEAQWWEDYGADAAYDREIDDAEYFGESHMWMNAREFAKREGAPTIHWIDNQNDVVRKTRNKK